MIDKRKWMHFWKEQVIRLNKYIWSNVVIKISYNAYNEIHNAIRSNVRKYEIIAQINELTLRREGKHDIILNIDYIGERGADVNIYDILSFLEDHAADAIKNELKYEIKRVD